MEDKKRSLKDLEDYIDEKWGVDPDVEKGVNVCLELLEKCRETPNLIQRESRGALFLITFDMCGEPGLLNRLIADNYLWESFKFKLVKKVHEGNPSLCVSDVIIRDTGRIRIKIINIKC